MPTVHGTLTVRNSELSNARKAVTDGSRNVPRLDSREHLNLGESIINSGCLQRETAIYEERAVKLFHDPPNSPI